MGQSLLIVVAMLGHDYVPILPIPYPVECRRRVRVIPPNRGINALPRRTYIKVPPKPKVNVVPYSVYMRPNPVMIHNPYVKRQEFEKILKSIPDPPSLDSYKPKPGQTFLESLFEKEKKPMPQIATTITLDQFAVDTFLIEACDREDKSDARVTLHHEKDGDQWTVEFPPRNDMEAQGISVAVTYRFSKKEVDDLLLENVRKALKDEGGGGSSITYVFEGENLKHVVIELKGRAR